MIGVRLPQVLFRRLLTSVVDTLEKDRDETINPNLKRISKQVFTTESVAQAVEENQEVKSDQPMSKSNHKILQQTQLQKPSKKIGSNI